MYNPTSKDLDCPFKWIMFRVLETFENPTNALTLCQQHWKQLLAMVVAVQNSTGERYRRDTLSVQSHGEKGQIKFTECFFIFILFSICFFLHQPLSLWSVGSWHVDNVTFIPPSVLLSVFFYLFRAESSCNDPISPQRSVHFLSSLMSFCTFCYIHPVARLWQSVFLWNCETRNVFRQPWTESCMGRLSCPGFITK